MTIPVPRGKLLAHVISMDSRYANSDTWKSETYKSRPTMFSRTELFPLDCEPTTTICGRSMGFWTCRQASVFVVHNIAISVGVAGPTYSYCCEDILELVDKSNKPRVVYVDTAREVLLALRHGYRDGQRGQNVRCGICRHGGRGKRRGSEVAASESEWTARGGLLWERQNKAWRSKGGFTESSCQSVSGSVWGVEEQQLL